MRVRFWIMIIFGPERNCVLGFGVDVEELKKNQLRFWTIELYP